ncbi:MAG: M1 family metallopeptidase [Candidatus Methanofastidiosia archaeon]
MKKKIASLAFIAMILTLPVHLCASTQSQGSLDEYCLDIVVDTDNFFIRGTENVKYFNKSDSPLNEVYFFLYPNAFRYEDSVPLISSFEGAYPNGFDEGFINVEVRSFEYDIEEDIYLKVELDKPLAPDRAVGITIDFEIKIPETRHRFGHYDDVIYAANCFPIASVYENDEWKLYPYLSLGDPFYSLTSNWNVKILIDNRWKVASTGKLQSATEENGFNYLEISAPLSRDFAFACSPRYELKKDYLENIEIFSYYLPGHEMGGTKALEMAKRSLDYYQKIYGDYPYEIFTVAETFLSGAGGMEYPQIIFADSYYYNYPTTTFFEIIIAHETGHQWWYSTVGNNEITESFLDESLTEYSTCLYFEHYYENGRELCFGDSVKMPLRSYFLKGYGGTIDKPLQDFLSSYEYWAMLYAKGPIILDMLRWHIGTDAFIATLSEIYESNRFGVLTQEAFEKAFETSFPDKELAQFFDIFLRSETLPDIAAGDATVDEDGNYTIAPLYKPFALPTEITVEFADGSTIILDATTFFEGKFKTLPQKYYIDPLDKIFEENELNNSGTFTIIESEHPNDENNEQEGSSRHVPLYLLFLMAVVIAAGLIYIDMRKRGR